MTTQRKATATPDEARFQVPMTLVRDTKGTHVYASVADDAPITQLYIRKAGSFGGTPPQAITVTVA